MDKQISFLVAIHEACNLTFLRYQALKNFFKGDFEQAFNAKIKDWQSAGIDKVGIEKFFIKRISPDLVQDNLLRCGAEVFFLEDKKFPLGLKNIPNPPVLLFMRGQMLLSDFPCLSVVGSRRVSHYGKAAMENLLSPLVQSGITTVSGLAFGVDKLTHELSLKNKQRTIAVLGSGIDAIYPKNHQYLVDRILSEDLGAIVSEYLPGILPRPEHFPQRNRIVSGLSKAVVLVEAAEKSGTLITAAWANEQGRDIFAIPGSVFSSQSEGTNRLIADGLATALVDPSQLSNLFGERVTSEDVDFGALSDISRQILGCFEESSEIHLDEIVRKLPFPQPVVSSEIMMLEVQGLIRNVGNLMYIKLI